MTPTPAQRILLGVGVPLAAVAAIVSTTRRRPTDDEDEAKTPIVAATGPQTFQSSPFDLARLTAALSADDGTTGTVNRPPTTTTPAGPDLTALTVPQLQAQCETAPGGEPYLSELLRRQVSVNDPGFKRPDGRATTCGAFYVLRLLQAGAVPA